MVGSELDAVLQERYPNNTDVQHFHINSRRSLRSPDNLGTTDLHIQCGYIRVTTVQALGLIGHGWQCADSRYECVLAYPDRTHLCTVYGKFRRHYGRTAHRHNDVPSTRLYVIAV
jgi:hypothetical protein